MTIVQKHVEQAQKREWGSERERKRDKERARQTDRQTDRQKMRETVTMSESSVTLPTRNKITNAIA